MTEFFNKFIENLKLVEDIVVEWDFTNIVSVIKDIVNIFFFIITGCIGVLTYKKAKSTILQPIKTEVFKIQLKLFDEIMSIFNGKSEKELIDYFHMGKFEDANITYLFDMYAEIFFDVKFDEINRPYNSTKCPHKHVKKDYIEKHFDLEVSPYNPEIPTDFIEMTKEEVWNEFEMGILFIPLEHQLALKEITKIMESPVLPKKAAQILRAIIYTIANNREVVRDVLNEVSKELPSIYENLELLNRANSIWIKNKIDDKIEPIDIKAQELTDCLRDYLMVENLFK